MYTDDCHARDPSLRVPRNHLITFSLFDFAISAARWCGG